MTNFGLAYSNLNPAQKIAVDAIEGPVLVLAGPGTGKTQVLTTRIANILKQTDTEPSSILALTFTESAIKEMRSRLIKLIGKEGYHVKISTFHGFCSEVISENPDRFSRPAGMQNITDLEKIQILQQILNDGSFLSLKPVGDPLFYLPYIISSIGNLKREGFTVQKYLELVSILKDEFEIEKDQLKKTAFLEREKLVNKNLDLLEIYQQYQNKIQELGRFDYEDMINWVVEAFEKDPEFLQGYQERYQYFLVDEFQDTNSAQNRLLFALSSFWGQQANVFAVGDPNQSIYRFQGASKENVEQFQATFPNHVKVVLDQNYRSTQILLDSSAKLLEEKPLLSNSKLTPEKIKVAQFNTSLFEDEFVGESIKEKIESCVPASDIAVIAKENKDLEILVNLFKQKNIPYRLEGSSDILTAPLIIQFIKILRLTTSLNQSVDDTDLFTVLNYPYFKLEPQNILQLAREAHSTRQSFVNHLLGNTNILDKFVSWNSLSASVSLPEIFQTILQESGLLNHLLNHPQSVVELSRFSTLFEEVKKQSLAFPGITLAKFLENLVIMYENRLKLEEQVIFGSENAVTLTTAHKSKGLEWNNVYIYRFADTHWGNKARREMIKLPDGIIRFENLEKEEDQNSEERRLFYVALTRAKQEVFLTGSTSYDNSTRMIFPAIFYNDLPSENLEVLDTKVFEKSTEKTLLSRLQPPANKSLDDQEVEYLKKLLEDFKLSPTSLNTYLDCHYKFKLDNLYRIPRSKSASMCFGTAVHYALEQLSKKSLNKSEFISEFQKALEREILSPNDLRDRLEYGKKVLSKYYDQYQDSEKTVLFTEKNFGTATPILLEDVPLTGKVDRIDLLNKKEKNVLFVDYKTGKPRTRGEIEGTTKNSNGDYKRQLVFYHLLAELDKSFDYHLTTTQLDFVETDAKGDYHQESFSITKEETENLKTLIKDSMKSIRSLDFSRTTDITKCPTCPFYRHCWT